MVEEVSDIAVDLRVLRLLPSEGCDCVTLLLVCHVFGVLDCSQDNFAGLPKSKLSVSLIDSETKLHNSDGNPAREARTFQSLDV